MRIIPYTSTHFYRIQKFYSLDIIKTNLQESFFTNFCLINALESKCSPFPATKQVVTHSTLNFVANYFLGISAHF